MKKINSLHTNEPIFPVIQERKEKPFLVLSTYLRKKGDDGKWYLQHFRRSLTDSEYLDIGYAYRQFISEVYRIMLFGIVGEGVLLNGEPLFYLDENQYSEQGRWYAMDNLLFPKGNQPKKSVKYPREYDDELLEIWNERFNHFNQKVETDRETEIDTDFYCTDDMRTRAQEDLKNGLPVKMRFKK